MVQVSPGPGGDSPRKGFVTPELLWSRDGRHVYYWQPVEEEQGVKALFRGSATPSAGSLAIGVPERLSAVNRDWAFPAQGWDVGPDGRFLVAKVAFEKAESTFLDKVFTDRIVVDTGGLARLLADAKVGRWAFPLAHASARTRCSPPSARAGWTRSSAPATLPRNHGVRSGSSTTGRARETPPVGRPRHHPGLFSLLEATASSPTTVVLAGPRQCGKTTLARKLVPPGSASDSDLEDPVSLARLGEPATALSPLRGRVVLDEVQRRPALFPYLRALVDRRPLLARLLVLGSASPALLRQATESLAGRVEVVSLGGFSMAETGVRRLSRHWLRGGVPRSFLARSAADSHAWRRQLILTFLERDLPQLGVSVPATALLRFWTMLAHVHGGVWNAADPARSLGLSEPTPPRSPRR